MNQQENILSYLRGELSEAEKLEFEQRLKSDPDLSAELARQQQSWQLLGDIAARQEQKAEIGSWIAEAAAAAPAAKVRRFSPMMRYAAVAAAIIILAAIGYLLRPQSVAVEDLYADYYLAYTPSQTMGDGNLTDSLYQQGVKAFKEKKYDAAITELEQITSETSKYAEARMLIAASYMQQEKYAEAIPYFEEAAQSPNLADEAVWYQALAYMMNGETEEAKSLFKKIAASQGYKHQEAASLLKKI